MNTTRGNRRAFAAVVRGALIGAAIGVAFIAGFLFRGGIPSLAAPVFNGSNGGIAQPVDGYPLLAQAQSLLAEHYVHDLPSQKTLEYGAIRGLLGTLNDRLTYFIEPPTAASESNVLAGQYGGIGVQVKRDEAGRAVLYPFREGPAIRAGVQDGDILLKVNGENIAPALPQDAVDQLLRGEVKAGNGVKILIQHPAGEEKEFFILFETIEVPSVVWRALAEESTFGYVQILRFTSRTPEELKKALTELRGSNDKAIRALVLDLRSNPGGLLQESITVASQFLQNDKVVLYEKNRQNEKEYRAKDGATIADLPLVVLINQNTASAAELVAGALKDHNRAKLIGQRSYGKGTVQLIFQLADKSSLHVSTAEFFPPSRAQLEGKGIEPDIPMIPDVNGRDVELGEAIRFLRSELPK